MREAWETRGVNTALWEKHLTERNAQLELEIRRLRTLVGYQRHRAELWKHRACSKRRRTA